MKQLPAVMEEIRKSTTTEGRGSEVTRAWNAGAVVYLERDDGAAIGLLKVKSHWSGRGWVSMLRRSWETWPKVTTTSSRGASERP